MNATADQFLSHCWLITATYGSPLIDVYYSWSIVLTNICPLRCSIVDHIPSTFSSANDAINITLFHWGLFYTGPLSLFETGLGYHVTTESHTFDSYPKQLRYCLCVSETVVSNSASLMSEYVSWMERLVFARHSDSADASKKCTISGTKKQELTRYSSWL